MFFFTFCIFGRHVESIILCWRNDIFFYHAGKKVWKCLLIQEIQCPNGLEASFLNSATSIWEVLPKWILWWKHFASTGSFAPTSNDFRWFLHGICLFGQKRLASIVSSCCFFLGMRKRNNIFYQRNIKLMFAHVNKMCKRSNIFYERSIVRTR